MGEGKKYFGWLLACAAATNVVPLYLTTHPPFSDLPEHIAAIATIRHYWDPTWDIQQYFVLQGIGRTPYLLYDVVAALLAVLFGSAERANLFLLSIVGLSFTYALRDLLRATGRDERLAIMACPLWWNRALAEGLLNYVAAIPVALWGLAIVAKQTDHPTKRRHWGLAAMSLVILYLHVSAFLVFVLGSVVLTVCGARARGPSRSVWPTALTIARDMSWLLAPALATVPLVAQSSLFHPRPEREGIHAGVVHFSSNAFLLRSLFPWMHDFWRSPVDDIAAWVMWGLFAFLVFWRSPHTLPARPAQGAAGWLAALGLLLYFFSPNQVSFAFILDLRLAPFVGLLAPLALRPKQGRLTSAVFFAMGIVSLVVGAHAAWQMRAYERDEASSFDRVLQGLPRGKKMLALIFDRESQRANITPFLHFGSYYAARFGGLSSFSFAEVPHWPVQFRPGAEPPKKKMVFWDWNPCLYRNSVDGPYYDFVLSRGDINPFAGDPPGPRWRAIGVAREWTLYEKTNDMRPPVDGKDDTGPCGPADTVSRPR